MLYALDMLNKIEKMKRGGLCFVGSKKYMKAINQQMPDDDPNKPSDYIIYEDANHLYGCNMTEYLPYKDLKSDNNENLETILNTSADNDMGYIIKDSRSTCSGGAP